MKLFIMLNYIILFTISVIIQKNSTIFLLYLLINPRQYKLNVLQISDISLLYANLGDTPR